MCPDVVRDGTLFVFHLAHRYAHMFVQMLHVNTFSLFVFHLAHSYFVGQKIQRLRLLQETAECE